MIENIKIQTVASFGDAPEILAGLSKFNFIHGANGTGKTTVSRAIADETRFPFCKVAWQLESLANVLNAAKGLVSAANEAIQKHNTMVSNLAQERRTLTSEVWKFPLENEIKAQLAAYSTKKDGLNKAIAALSAKIKQAEEDKRKKQAEIRALEKNTTSIQPTIDGINLLLKSFGFLHGLNFLLWKLARNQSLNLNRSRDDSSLRPSPRLARRGRRIFVGRFSQGGTAFALGYYLSLRWSFEFMNTKDFLRLGVPFWTFGRLDNEWKLKEVVPVARGGEMIVAENVDEGSSPDQLQWFYKQTRAN